MQSFLLSRLLSSSEPCEDGQRTSVRGKAINMAFGTWEKAIQSTIHRRSEFFSQAIDADRSFACAHSALAMALVLGWTYGTLQEEDLHRMVADRAQEAVEIDPNDVEAQAIVALARFNVDGDDRGLATLSEALLRNPNAAWAHGVKACSLSKLVVTLKAEKPCAQQNASIHATQVPRYSQPILRSPTTSNVIIHVQ